MERRELLKSFLGMFGIPFVGIIPRPELLWLGGSLKPYNIVPMDNWELRLPYVFTEEDHQIVAEFDDLTNFDVLCLFKEPVGYSGLKSLQEIPSRFHKFIVVHPDDSMSTKGQEELLVKVGLLLERMENKE